MLESRLAKAPQLVQTSVPNSFVSMNQPMTIPQEVPAPPVLLERGALEDERVDLATSFCEQYDQYVINLAKAKHLGSAARTTQTLVQPSDSMDE